MRDTKGKEFKVRVTAEQLKELHFRAKKAGERSLSEWVLKILLPKKGRKTCPLCRQKIVPRERAAKRKDKRQWHGIDDNTQTKEKNEANTLQPTHKDNEPPMQDLVTNDQDEPHEPEEHGRMTPEETAAYLADLQKGQ